MLRAVCSRVPRAVPVRGYSPLKTGLDPIEAAEDSDRLEDPDLEGILENNRAWVEKMRATDDQFFERIRNGQMPKYLYIGCSDSRVPANEIMGLGAGEVFVHRNVANMVVNSDINLLSVLTFAVEYLKVDHILVTGHYDCGGVKAACSRVDHGLLEAWICNIRDVRRLHREELSTFEDPKDMHKRLVELNVIEQCLNVYKTGTVQRRRAVTYAKSGRATPRIHGMVFEPGEGLLKKLPIDFKKEIESNRSIYDLYDIDDSAALAKQ